ncbi:MAG TPA: COX15/CtaA family protein [Polyangia bacterium]|jgi:cytochrome c oxidase assembly protein subunit 15
MTSRRFATFAWLVLAYNLAVIAWGAYVRATGSGAGCGQHWPLCNGEVMPRTGSVALTIELTHRVSSGFVLVLAAALIAWAFKAAAKGHPVRRAAVGVGVLTVTEAVVGAGLVLLKLVGTDASMLRALSMAVHLTNTFLLVGALTLTAAWATWDARPRPRAHLGLGLLIVSGLEGVLVVGVSGAIAALGDTLFPAATLGAGLAQDFSATAHLLVRLRVLHPFIAVAVGLLLLVIANVMPAAARREGRLLLGLVLVQLGAGALSVALLAPVWLQLVHLLLADLVWIALVLAGNRALAAPVPARAATAAPLPAGAPG